MNRFLLMTAITGGAMLVAASPSTAHAQCYGGYGGYGYGHYTPSYSYAPAYAYGHSYGHSYSPGLSVSFGYYPRSYGYYGGHRHHGHYGSWGGHRHHGHHHYRGGHRHHW